MNENSRVFDCLQYQLEKFPKKDMLVSKENGQWIPYNTAEVKQYVDQLSAGLLSLGLSGNSMTVDSQDKIAIISKNRPEWVFLDLACQQIGVILCPIYPTTNTPELEFIFKEAAVKYVFISGKEILEKVNAVKSNIPSLLNIYSFDELEGVSYWKDLLDENENVEKIAAIKNNIKPEHCCTIIYTSGTTGTPKGVMLSHHNIESNVKAGRPVLPVVPDMRILSSLPLCHVFERMVCYLFFYVGVSVYYAERVENLGESLK